MKNLMKLTALALVAIAASTIGASAQITPAANPGDLILGFRLNDSGTEATNLEVDLGAASMYTSSYSNSSIVNLGSDLSATFGSDWASNANLVFGAAGQLNPGGSNKSYSVTDNTAPTTTVSNVNLTTASNKIAGLIAGINQATAFSDNTNVGTITNASGAALTAGSFSNELGVTAANANPSPFGTTYIPKPAEAGVSTTDATLSLYSFVGGVAPSLSGTFHLNGTTGILSFNPVATPEPSAYALGICALLLFWVLARRSSIV